MLLALDLEKTPRLVVSSRISFPIAPVILRISSRPHAPASALCPSAQFRKRARLFENSIGLNGFSAGPRPFRAWVLGQEREAGSWGRDEIRNITGAVAELFGQQDGGATGAMQISLLNNRTAATGSGAGYGRVSFDASNGVPTGPLNVPPHVWQPVAIYLGRPK